MNRKNQKGILIISVVSILLITLIFLNVRNGQSQQELREGKSVAIYLNEIQVGTISYEEIADLSVEFTETFKRKVGDPSEHTYKGMPLNLILDLIDVKVGNDYSVSVSAIDNYTIALTEDEFLKEDNVYLVYEEDGEMLDSDNGPYMLVIRDDELSTRWNKQVVKIQIDEQ